MDNNEAREILIGFNSWRRGEDEDVIYTPQFSPKLIGQAIDFAIQALGEPETIKPYHEHGNSVASDRTESGQSADGGIAIMEILQPIHRHPFDAESGREMEIWYTHKDVWNAMTTYASQVCADKEADLQDMTAMRESAMRTVKNLADRIEPLQNEIDRLNESMTVMLRRNAELEAQIDQFTNPLRIK